jgi:aspartyl-tRNA synthetase
MVAGKIAPREKPDPTLPTGDILVDAWMVRILSHAKEPLLFDFHTDKIARGDRIRHRYLWLRNSKVHELFRFRTEVLAELRRHLVARGFDEVETPLLANRFTPDAAESFLAIRGRREVFALPGRRPVHPTILMASGFDRVFEVSRRLSRKKSYGPFQQPEFSVLDVSLAYSGERDLFRVEDDLFAHVWSKALGEELVGTHERVGDGPGPEGTALPKPIPTLTFDEAFARYGSDCPDLRFGLELAGPADGAWRGFAVPGGAARLKEKEGDLAKLADGKTAALHLIGADGKAAPALDAATAADAARTLALKPGDFGVVARSYDRTAAAALAGRARALAGRALGGFERKHALVRITRLPFFRYDTASAAWVLRGDPLTRAVPEELEGDPHRMRGLAHHLVLDGVNVGGGSIRNHSVHEQQQLFGALGLDALDLDRRYGALLQVLRFGVPPHGRFAVGIDRLVALLRGLESIDDVIALPKMPDGSDPLTRSPWPIDNDLVRGLFGL